jgi:hypothetical protein
MESPRLGQARYSHLCICGENLKNVYVYYTYVLMSVVSVDISVVYSVYHLPFLEAEFCILAPFAIWWQSVELQRSA